MITMTTQVTPFNASTGTIQKSNLTTASRQWAERPVDERFWTLADMYNRTEMYQQQSRVAAVDLWKCRIDATPENDLVLVGPQGGKAEFTNYSFGQLCALVKQQAGGINDLPAELVAPVLNYRINKTQDEYQMLFRSNGRRHLQCITSGGYTRIWNHEVASLALELESLGWRVPPARPNGMEGLPVRIATEQDCLQHRMPGLGIHPGMEISPAGIYASDRDCFIFMVNEDRPINGGNGETLYRGFFMTNSEVGDKRFKLTMFLYESVCGNHIVWSSTVVGELAFRHVGDARKRFQEAFGHVRAISDTPASVDEGRIEASKLRMLGPGRDEVVNAVFEKGLLTRGQADKAYDLALANEHVHGSPRSAWGFVSGVTRLSQTLKYAEERDRLDRAAGRILTTTF